MTATNSNPPEPKSSEIPTIRGTLTDNFDNPKPLNGVVPNLPMSRYRNMAGIAPSDFKVASEEFKDFKKRPGNLNRLGRSKIARWCSENEVDTPFGIEPPKKGDHYDFGTMWHTLLIEPDTFDSSYVILTEEKKDELLARSRERKISGPKYPTDFNARWGESTARKKALGRDLNDAEKAEVLQDRQTKFVNEIVWHDRMTEYVDWIDEQRASGLMLVNASLVSQAQRMVDAIYSQPVNSQVAEIFSAMKKDHIECCLFYAHDYKSKLPTVQLKGRTDLLDADFIFDPKTTLDIHPDFFEREVELWGYDFSMAQYVWLSERLAGHPDCEAYDFPKKRAGFLAQEKFAPFEAEVYWINNEVLNFKKKQVERVIAEVAQKWNENRLGNSLAGEQELMPSPWLQKEIDFIEGLG